MADSHPFSNAGLGMFGSAERSFASSAMGNRFIDENAKKKEPGLLELLGTFIGKQIGNSSKSEPYSIDGAIPAPETSLPAVTATPAGVAPPGINPVAPMGLGINFNRPATGLNTFGNNPMGGQQASGATYNPITMQIWGKTE